MPKLAKIAERERLNTRRRSGTAFQFGFFGSFGTFGSFPNPC